VTGPGRPRGRALAWALCAAALAVGATLGYLLQDRILEAWHLRRFREGDRETKLDAARRLSALKSAEVAPLLLEEIQRGVEAEMRRQVIISGKTLGFFRPYERELIDDLVAIGEPALPALIALAPSDRFSDFMVASLVLEKIDPRFGVRPHRTDEPEHYTGLRQIAGDPTEDPELRSLASGVLLRLEKRWRANRIR
jgi:hypothetical protein